MVLPSLVFFIYVGEMRVIVSIYVKREGIIVGPPLSHWTGLVVTPPGWLILCDWGIENPMGFVIHSIKIQPNMFSKASATLAILSHLPNLQSNRSLVLTLHFIYISILFISGSNVLKTGPAGRSD